MLRSLKLVGMQPIIVHGGGKEISKWIGLLERKRICRRTSRDGRRDNGSCRNGSK